MTAAGAPASVTDLRSRRAYAPDVVSLACSKVRSAREQAGLSVPAFAAALAPLLGWTPAPDLVRTWESAVAPPGQVVVACEIVASRMARAAAPPGSRPTGEPAVPDGLAGIAGLTAWITATNTSNEVIGHIERVASALAEMHTRVPDRKVLADVMQLHRTAQVMLQGGRQRLRQTRELVRLDGEILAHASVLLSNLGEGQAAEDYGQAALLYLQEAEASQAKAWYALAKIARWQHNYAAAADLARHGLEQGHARDPVSPMSVQLASYEANAAALLGDRSRARQALARAGSIAERLPPGDGELSPWSFPVGRQAIFRLSVLLRTGDPGGALRAAAAAEDNWAGGGPRNPWTWAQVRIGAAIALLFQGSPDGAADQVAPVLALAPDMRITTVTGWLADLDKQLARSRFATSQIAASLTQQIREFTAGALREAG